jgi:hypothetical protein
MAAQEHKFLKNGSEIFFAEGIDANSENQPVETGQEAGSERGRLDRSED